MENYDASDLYWQYLKDASPTLDLNSLPHIAASLKDTSWEDPISAIDLNNFAAIAWIQAENSDDASVRDIYLEMACEALTKGIELYANPLCAAHLVFLLMTYGEIERSLDLTFYYFHHSVEAAYVKFEETSPGIVYLPDEPQASLKIKRDRAFKESLQATEGYHQALLLLSHGMERLKTKSVGRSEIEITKTFRYLRVFEIAVNLLVNSLDIYLNLGFSLNINNFGEGDIYFTFATKLLSSHSYLLQSLYLTCLDLKEREIAAQWLDWSKKYGQIDPQKIEGKWVNLAVDSPVTYIAFEEEIVLAVEPTCRSMVTSILICQGDWFENEMEFWRSQIQPGMTVLDVGANAGVYTFSAARRVRSEGRVLAIEPFPGCVRCLQETSIVNQFSWVTVCEGAASDREGTVKLSLSTSSELNQIISGNTDTETKNDPVLEVPCFCLDSLIDREHLHRVDFLKIDAEGHEMQVLAGSDRILTEFTPTILYENSNPAVGHFLQSKGYQLFIYQPYVKNLVPIDSPEDWKGTLNIIAVPQAKV